MTLFRTAIVALVLAIAVVCVGGMELCETTVHLPANELEPADRAAAHRIAAAFGASLEEIQITAADGTALKGWFFRSAKAGAEPVILLHGQGDNRRGMRGIAAFLLRAGYPVLIPDVRGHGENGGMVASYGFREVGDVSEWVRWLDRNAPSKCVYGLGVSMGAAILIQSLPDSPRICAAVAESPYSSFHEIGLRHASVVLGVTGLLPQAFVAVGFTYARLRYGIDFNRVSPEEAITRTTTPVLLIHGTADSNIPIAESRAILQHRPQGTELWEIADARHVQCYAKAGTQYERRVLAWFDKGKRN